MTSALPRSREYFMGAKTHGAAVPAAGIMRDVLIQASLDPTVAAIGHIGSIELDGRRHWIDAHTVTRDDGTIRMLAVLSGPEETNDLAAFAGPLGSTVETLLVDEIVAQPRLSAAREIWSHRHVRVPTLTRSAIIQILRDDGPMTMDSLCRCVPGSRDPEAIVMSLLCATDIELVEALGPGKAFDHATLLRSR